MILRLVPASLFGLGVSLGLFWLMHAMLRHHADLTERNPLTQVDFVRLKSTETAPETVARELPPPPVPDAPVPPPDAPSAVAPSPSQPVAAFDMPKLNLPVGGGTIAAPVTGTLDWSMAMPALDAGATPGATGLENSALTPIVRIPPTYPMQARRLKTEGWVKLEFTVQEDGSVVDIKVRDAKPAGTFDQAAMAAIGQWKFRPAMENGKPIRKRAMQTLKFELDK